MKYSLDKRSGKKKFTCPSCLKPKTFTLYVDIVTGDYLSEQFGMCDRINNCGYNLTPWEFMNDTNVTIVTHDYFKAEIKEPSFIDTEYFKRSVQANEGGKEDNFTRFLIEQFGEEVATELKIKYNIGKSSLWSGATVFWQKDANGKIRTGKTMHYDVKTGKRIKGKNDWVHNRLIKNGRIKSFNLAQCYFGEHLLVSRHSDPVGVVESEKTAIICSFYFPKLIWLASGSIQGINIEKSKVLKGRKVFLFPDLNGLAHWQKKAQMLRSSLGLNCKVYDWLEKNANSKQIKDGLDLADFLLENNLIYK